MVASESLVLENNDYKDGIVTELGLKFENGDIKQSKIQNLNSVDQDEQIYSWILFISPKLKELMPFEHF